MVNDSKTQTKLALVVDDSAMQCKVLAILLKEEGYDVLTANDGARGVALYINHQPDLVLMDINMPVMNGYQAARKIKSLSNKNSLCPLIFITSLDSDEAFIDSIEAGGDGILVRPFSPDVFKAKIKSIQRINDLYSQIKELQQEQQKDAELAEQLMSGVIEAKNYALDKIGIVKKAAALFSGDIQLTALSPNGDINVLLGDFTGHGLRSSIGAIPLAETFRAMTKKGFSPLEVINQVNTNLYQLLPSDLFLAACMVTVSSHDKSAYIFNAGLPDTYIFSHDGRIKHKVSSFHPPLGVLPNLLSEVGLKVISVEETDRVVLISDGIVEAHNEKGDMFGFERFEQSAIEGVINHNISQYVLNSVNKFCQSMQQEDDISLIDLPCQGWQQKLITTHLVEDRSLGMIDESTILPAWRWELSLAGKRLAQVNPVPIMMNQIQEIEGFAEHWQSLFTILTELFINALDHGVLGLSSTLKSNPDGFAEYYSERERRLKTLTTGFVNISVSFFSLQDGGKVIVKVKDSGNGFDYSQYIGTDLSQASDNRTLSGRGIELVTRLCEEVNYHERGTQVEASYLW